MPTREPEINPAKQVSAELRGDLFAARQRYLDAIAAYREAPQDSAIVVNKMGVAYHHMFDIADARKNYQRAIQLDPKYAEAYNNLGATYHAEKNYKEAQRCYRKAIKLNPNSPLFYSNLGTAYFFQGNAKKGAEAYREAFALDPMVFEQKRGVEDRGRQFQQRSGHGELCAGKDLCASRDERSRSRLSSQGHRRRLQRQEKVDDRP